MATESTYYVPEQSKLPILMALGAGLFIYGAGSVMISGDPLFLLAGIGVMILVLFRWFSTVIDENMRGMADAQLKRSYVWGMSWFIFSEVMFFACFFGALFYVRMWALPWLSGESVGQQNPELLWNGFEAEWPLLTTPDQVVNGDRAQFIGAHEGLSFPGWGNLLHYLPLWNTVVLLASSVTVHFAHVALKANKRSVFNFWLGFTVALGAFFLYLQYLEYHHAYVELGLTLQSGIYGSTFFMLTGFHGAHVTMGTIFLAVQLLRSLRGHFKADDHFGFEAASWYWHFVDVVWVGLFIFVYVLG